MVGLNLQYFLKGMNIWFIIFGGMTDEFEESTVAWGSDSFSELGSKLGSNVVE